MPIHEQRPKRFLNWVAGQSTRLEAAGDADSDDHLNLKCSSATNNISRANKHLVCVRLAQFKADQKESDSGKESFSVQFKAADCDNEEPRWNKCVYYVDSKADEVAQSDTSALDKLAMDFDQLTTCLADGLTKAVLFVTVDNSNPNNMNMLGLLKYDEEDREYSFV